MRYAEVTVDAPAGHNRTFTYSIPPALHPLPGQMVWVPFGPRVVQGIVFQLTASTQVEPVKDMLAVVGSVPLVSPIHLELARWVSQQYLASLFDCAALMLPPGFRNRIRSYLQPAGSGSVAGGLPAATERALVYLRRKGEVEEGELKAQLGREGERIVRWLLRKGLALRMWEWPRPRVLPQYRSSLRLGLPVEEAVTLAEEVAQRAPRQAALLRAFRDGTETISTTLARKEYGESAVASLLRRGTLGREWVRVEREPEEGLALPEEPLPVPTPDQQRALAEVTTALKGQPGTLRSFLLYGVTGSGKTEVYLQALAHQVAQGRTGILLVPEISLTPQMLHRLNARFPGRVAVLHSGMALGEQFDQWWRIQEGAYQVVVGPRSALFAPLSNLGLIVVDEEHEWTYKQQEGSPRYHAREAALRLGELTGAVVLLGSATPAVESYHRALRGGHRLLELPQRIAVHAPDPGTEPVEVVDMAQELRQGNRSIFSRALAEALEQCLARGEQAILFLNRRGAATVIQCRDCGYVACCRRCAVALTYHAAGGRLLCHHCNTRYPTPARCPRCASPRIRYLGLGTQRVVDELGRLFPTVPVLRWDRDVAGTGRAHGALLERFARGEAPILVGTQMVAKGLHIPSVTVVGVVLADVGLHLPDFRAGERTFQLLCQVAGRAGRGPTPGRVIIQTYNPGHYAIQAAARQDYPAFFRRELAFRQEQGDPPFGRLVHLVYAHTNAAFCQREAERMARTLRHQARIQGLAEVAVIGTAPAFPQRVRGRYRWHLILRGPDPAAFLAPLPVPHGWTVDVDPVSVL
ncbi:MAG: primosomal protein N' [Dehalococcoidia bacterium]